MNWDVAATIMSTVVGTVGTFIGAGMLWVASSLRDDVRELNRLVTGLTGTMVPREEYDRKHEDMEASLRGELRDLRKYVDDVIGSRTNTPGYRAQ